MLSRHTLIEKLKMKKPTNMTRKRTIKVKEIVDDVRSGVSAEEMIRKYNLSPNLMRNILVRIVVAKKLDETEVQNLYCGIDESLAVRDRRKDLRYYVYVPLPIYDVENLMEEGQVVDISEGGLRINGIQASQGEKREFVVQPDYFGNAFPFCFEATCRWSSQNESGEWVAGFEISTISDGGLEQLRQIVRMLALPEGLKN
jgi:hypothetical protein